jgi:hypothetical protein
MDQLRVPARLGYLGIPILISLSPLHLDRDPVAMAERMRRMLRPTVSPRDAVDGARDVVLFAG